MLLKKISWKFERCLLEKFDVNNSFFEGVWGLKLLNNVLYQFFCVLYDVIMVNEFNYDTNNRPSHLPIAYIAVFSLEIH